MKDERMQLVLFSEVNSKFGYPFLLELLQHPKVNVTALVTSPVDKLCSYYVQEPDAVDLVETAEQNGIRVYRPADVNGDEVIEELAHLQADFFLIANYQQILKEPLLAVPAQGTLNFHPSPLPRYAGLAPFFWMAKNGEQNGGVSCIQVEPKIDSGPLVAQLPVPLRGDETALEIRDRHFAESLSLLQQVLDSMCAGTLDAVPQDMSKRTYYSKVKERDLLIDWQHDSETVLRTIRAGYRYPGAFTMTEDGGRLVILSADHALPMTLDEAGTFAPGTIKQTADGVHVATRDGWIQIHSIEIDGEEIAVKSLEEARRLLNAKKFTVR
jgi:methionyl-tRNA formyltransferase